jgi:citrate lyase subunit beta/citryl-CoA lyase
MSTLTSDFRNARTLLFVPGNRPDRFEKALAAGADGVILDLEDAVPPVDKDAARKHVSSWLDHDGIVVRINDSSTSDFVDDLNMLADSGATVMLAKSENSYQVADVIKAIGIGGQVIPLIETAAGVLASESICAEEGVLRAALGGVDLAAQLGITDAHSPTLSLAYSQVVIASAAAGIGAPLASPTLQIDDGVRILEDTRGARTLGLGGKLCIHPAQIDPIHKVFAFTEDDISWAQRVLQAEATGGATQLDGQMLDRPVFERARWILATLTPDATPSNHQKETGR